MSTSFICFFFVFCILILVFFILGCFIMIAHVGIYPRYGSVAALYIHDNGKKEVTEYFVKEVNYIENIDIMFEQLKSKLSVPLGCACLCLSPMLEKYTNQFIALTLKIGFKKVEGINEATAKYVQIVDELDFQINQSSIIWIFDDRTLHIWKDNQCVDTIYNLYTEKNFENFVNNNSKPHAVNNQSRFYYITDWVKKFIPECKNIILPNVAPDYKKMALIYAKMMANEINWFKQDQVDATINFNKDSKVLPDIHPPRPPSAEIKQQSVNTPTMLSKIANKLFNTAVSSKTQTSCASNSQNIYSFPNATSIFDVQIPSLGIDLGTSKCCAAVNRRSGIETVALDYNGDRLLPSYVSYNEKNPICGQLVIDRLRHYAKYTVFDSKRIIGRSFNEIDFDSNWSFELTEINKKVLIEIRKADDRKGSVSAEEVGAVLLKHIKEKSEHFQGRKLNNVVITVPAAFKESQKSATERAAKLAGFTNIHLLPEPIAAAFAYFIDRPIPNNSTVLVFDLGGGTLDVCIFKIENDQLYIISNTGDSKLGGRDFDTVLINYFNNQLGSKYNVKLLRDRKYQLMTKSQTIKKNLSVLDESFLDIDEVDSTQKGIIPVTKIEFEKMTQNLLTRVRNTVNAALLNSNLLANQINKVLQVGGGSRMPMIKNLLHQLFPSFEHICEEHPEEVVAIGAAYYAYSIFSNTKN